MKFILKHFSNSVILTHANEAVTEGGKSMEFDGRGFCVAGC